METTTSEAPLKIQSLKIKNVQGVSEISIIADPTCNEMTGNNKMGKTSILQAILFALGGERYIPQKPVRIGEDEAEIWLETAEFEVSRRFKVDDKGNTKTALKVKLKNGTSGNQTYLNNLLGMLTFNPLDFMGIKAEEQIEMVKRLAGNEFVTRLDELNQAIETKFDERRDANRRVKEAGVPGAVPEVKAISATELLTERKELEAFNTLQVSRQTEINNAYAVSDLAKTKVKEARERLARAAIEQSQAEEAVKTAITIKDEKIELIKNLPNPETKKPLDEIESRTEKIDGINAQAQAYTAYLVKVATLDELERKAAILDEDLEGIREQRSNLMETAKLPIPGLDFTEDGITINDKPINQLSGSEQLDVSVQVGMELNPKIGIMLIQNGEQLDDGSMSHLIKLATKHGRQLWVATVGSGHTSVLTDGQYITIEDGKIKP